MLCCHAGLQAYVDEAIFKLYEGSNPAHREWPKSLRSCSKENVVLDMVLTKLLQMPAKLMQQVQLLLFVAHALMQACPL